MSRMWVVLGDSTSSGGSVVSGSPFTDIDGKPVARVNDKATCPQHKGTFPIVDGDPTTIIDGQPVAFAWQQVGLRLQRACGPAATCVSGQWWAGFSRGRCFCVPNRNDGPGAG